MVYPRGCPFEKNMKINLLWLNYIIQIIVRNAYLVKMRHEQPSCARCRAFLERDARTKKTRYRKPINQQYIQEGHTV